MKYFLKFGLAVFLVTLAITTSGVAVKSANATTGLTVSPASTDIEVAPGDTYEGTLRIVNESDAKMPYKAYVTPYSVTGEEYKPYFTPIKGAIDATKWFALSKAGGTLSVDGTAKIPYTITVPADTPGGSYFTTVFAETADKNSNESGVATRKRVGMVVYLRVSGDGKKAGIIDEWTASWLQEGPLHGMLKMSNTGTIHYKANVKVAVTDMFGNKKYDYVREAMILPQKRRAIPIDWEKGAAFGLFKVGGEVTYLGQTEKLPEKIVFVVNTPTRIAAGVVLLVAVIILVIAGRKRARVSRK